MARGQCSVVRAYRAGGAYYQLVGVELGETFSALCLSCFSDVFEQGAELFWVLKVVGSTAKSIKRGRQRDWRRETHTSRSIFAISAKRKGISLKLGKVVSCVRRS